MENELDLITGQPLPYSDDEPVRQAIEALLLKLGYAKDQVTVDASREVKTPSCNLRVTADLLVSIAGKPAMVIRCARGSIITREKEVLATARLLHDTWVLLGVATNSEDAELIEVATGEVLASGLDAIPGPRQLAERLSRSEPHQPTAEQTDKAACVYAAFSDFHCEAYCR